LRKWGGGGEIIVKTEVGMVENRSLRKVEVKINREKQREMV